MSPERWRQVTEIFHAARARDTAARGALLDEACGGDAELRSEVEAMLAAHVNAGGFGTAEVFAHPVEMARLQPGSALGPYRIEALIGSGGMGEVYRAHDARLGRKVAVKVLPFHVAGDARWRERLDREARAVAALSHPNICPVFDVGREDGVDYLVMEYLEGETLARRLEKGALPLEQALRRAVEIADALDKAHRQGIVHRDLKPANVMLTKAGARLLDFGLAKLAPASPLAALVGREPPRPSPLTGQGTILGTLQYMAPEQLNGEAVDARTDVFAFGAVLYEMVTGRKAFEGKSPASVVAAILEREPPAISTLEPMSPPALDHLVRTCLAKDPEQRWQSAGDLGRQLAWVLREGSSPSIAAAAGRRRSGRRAISLAGTALAGGLAVAAGARLIGPDPSSAPGPVAHLEYQLPEGQEFRNADRPVMAVSPDGRQFVYNTTRGLFLRALREPEARLVPGTEEDVSAPFFSPDGQWIGYFAAGQLKKIAVTGGTPIALCETESPFGAHWGTDGTIVYAQARGLMRVSANGGTPHLAVPADAGEQVDGPQILPGGKWVLVTVARTTGAERWDVAEVVAASLASGERKLLLRGGSAATHLTSGHLVFARKNVLHAVSLDLGEMRVSGEPVPVMSGIHRPPYPALHTGGASYGVSGNGTLVYLRSHEPGTDRVVALADRDGAVERLAVPPAPYANPRVSPDGARLAVQTVHEAGGWGDIWIYELSGNRQIRQLTSGSTSRYPLWTRDGSRVTFTSRRDGAEAVHSQPVDGSPAERLTAPEVGTVQRPDSWSPDGRTLAFRRQIGTEAAIWTLTPGGGKGPELFHDVPGSPQYEAEFSPDGKWIAYASRETGRDEIFLQPFPATGAKVRVTRNGGSFPLWSPDGRELFYRRSFDTGLYRSQGARLFRVSVAAEEGMGIGPERVVPIEGFLVFNTFRDYDITPDGRRFLLIYPGSRPPGPPRFGIVQNWLEELRALAPVR